MRNMNCRNVRREIEGAGPGELLSVAVNAHLENCAACQTLSREQSSLQAIVSSLGTVEAPGDFDFRLRARLAGERSGSSRPFALTNFSFGFRAAVVASVLLLLGSAFAFVSFRTQVDNSTTAGGKQAPSNPVNPAPATVKERDSHVANLPNQSDEVDRGPLPVKREPQKRRMVRNEGAIAKAGNRLEARDQSQTQARVMRSDGQDGTYPTAAFPINASYQSLKVSVDDGRGSSRTISLPSVSFGSQQALSQNASPVMASARDW